MEKQAKKKVVKLEELGKAHTREALRRVHPFLRKEYPKIEKSELESVELFQELFPEDKEIQLFKLAAIYAIQN